MKYTNIIRQLLIMGSIIATLTFLSTFSQENDGTEVFERIDIIDQSNTSSFPNIGADKSRSGSISDILTRLFNSNRKIKSLFIAAFDSLSVNAIPLWAGNVFIDSTLTQSGDTINVGGDMNIEGDLTFNISNFVSDIWLESGSDIFYNSGSVDVGIGTTNPQAKLDVGGAVIVGDTADACGDEKTGTIKFNSAGQIQYCSFINYAWISGNWSDWSSTCGSATRTRVVYCSDPAGNIVADGLCIETKPDPSETSVQGSSTCGWSSYGSWSTTCGPATRTRSCSTGAPGSTNCAGSDTDSSVQGSSTCGWSSYGSWSTTCGPATRTRSCSTGAPGSTNCAGSDTDSSEQGNSTCGWSGYSAWSTTCGDATRTRTCSTGAPGSTHCAGSDTDASNQGSSTCGWGGFSAWSTTCGSATRTRSCSTGSPGSTNCAGSTIESSTQGSSTCGWGAWGDYGGCSQSCGGGTKSRTRSCSTGSPGSANCAGSATSSTSCNTQSCYSGIWGSSPAAPSCPTACGSPAQTLYGSYASCQGPGSCDPNTRPARNSRYCAATAACPSGCNFLRPYGWNVGGNNCIESGGSYSTPMSHGQSMTVGGGSINTNGSATVQCSNGSIVQISATCQPGQIQ